MRESLGRRVEVEWAVKTEAAIKGEAL